jgi:transcription elongation factor Elf1
MACEKHGYTNSVFCPACDREAIQEFTAMVRDSVYFCPFCGKSEHVTTNMVEWRAESTEESDNKTHIMKHQCSDCGRSFWS